MDVSSGSNEIPKKIPHAPKEPNFRKNAYLKLVLVNSNSFVAPQHYLAYRNLPSSSAASNGTNNPPPARHAGPFVNRRRTAEGRHARKPDPAPVETLTYATPSQRERNTSFTRLALISKGPLRITAIGFFCLSTLGKTGFDLGGNCEVCQAA